MPTKSLAAADRVDPKACYGFDAASGTLYVSTDASHHFAASARHLGFGKPLWPDTPPVVYPGGTVDRIYGHCRSVDDGSSWLRINDDAHQFGQISSIASDPRHAGRVYLGQRLRRRDGLN